LAGTISREMLNDLVEANFVERDGPENERNVTIFKLTDEGREAAPDESGFLNAFDSNRDLICAAAAKVYVRGNRGSYDLVAANF
jgi:DNA-binding PadR family transcriptional regulator